MCGIAGFTHRHAPAERTRIETATRTLHHRGPDQWGCWQSATVSLGAVRLKILDLTGGDQPIATPDGNTVIVFNGEIYNHLELRADLEARGHRFHSHCDTETVLHAFVEWDTECFARLRGMFAIALWDQRQRRLLLARDRMGIKPLYFVRQYGDLYFGSELKALFAHPELPRRLDREGAAVFLTRNYPASNRTLLQGIEKLAPGSYLEWCDGQIEIQRYWQLRMQPQQWSVDEAEKRLDSLLAASVREHLLSDVPLGVWASGGLDSTTVLHYAANAGARLKTFSVSFLGRSFDESRWFREVAARYGTDHHEFDLDESKDILATVEQLPFYSDEPSADAGAVPVSYLSRMCRQHVTVALSGEGADELFGGYNTYLADRYAARLRAVTPPFLRRAALRLARLLPSSDEKIGLDYKLNRFLEGSLLPPQEAHLFWNGTFRNGELLPAFALPECEDFLLLDQQEYLVEDILAKCDRMSMAHSLEVRPPFLDHRIVEFANSLPHNFKIRGDTLKWLLRRTMRQRLPHSVLTRRKEGFDIPVHAWMRTILKPLLLDTLAAAPKGLLPLDRIHALADRHFRRETNAGYHLWGVLILLLWIRRWNVATN